jgi:hypothetical protein
MVVALSSNWKNVAGHVDISVGVVLKHHRLSEIGAKE